MSKDSHIEERYDKFHQKIGEELGISKEAVKFLRSELIAGKNVDGLKNRLYKKIDGINKQLLKHRDLLNDPGHPGKFESYKKIILDNEKARAFRESIFKFLESANEEKMQSLLRPESL